MPFDPSKPEPESTRRGMLVGVGLVGIAGTLSACGGSKDDSSGDASKSSGGDSKSSDGAFGKTSDIPVGGGKIFKSEKVVVTQPKQGEFKAFSATCTHRGCTVGTISGDAPVTVTDSATAAIASVTLSGSVSAIFTLTGRVVVLNPCSSNFSS